AWYRPPIPASRPQASPVVAADPVVSGQHAPRADEFDQALDRCVGCQVDAFAGPALLDLDLAVSDALRADDQLKWRPDQVHGREFCPGPLVGVLIKDRDARAPKLGVEIFAGLVRLLVPNLEVDQGYLEWRHGNRPDDAGGIMARLDDGPDQAGDADAVGAHLHRNHAAVRSLYAAPHGFGILGAEEENVTDLDAARRHALGLGHLRLEAGRVVLLVGGR